MEPGYEKTGHYPWFIPSHSHRRLLIRVSDGTEFSLLMSNPMRFQGRQSKERTAAQVTTNDFSPWFPLLNNPSRNKTKLRDKLVENSFFHAFFYLTKLILSRFGCISKCLGSLFFNLVPYKEVKVIHNVVFSSFSSLSLSTRGCMTDQLPFGFFLVCKALVFRFLRGTISQSCVL